MNSTKIDAFGKEICLFTISPINNIKSQVKNYYQLILFERNKSISKSILE